VKWVFSALLIVNVAILLWPSGEKRSFSAIFSAQPASGPGGFGGADAGDPPINPKDLLLLSEKISVEQSDTTVAVVNPEPEVSEQDPPQSPKPPAQPSGEATEARHCLRIGPFFRQDERTAARKFVASFEVPVSTQVVDGRVVRSWRAFLGPFTTAAETDEAERRAIKAGFVKSRKVDKPDNGGKIVSLGLFSTEKSAQRVLGKTRFSTLNVQIREERTRLPSTNWLEVSGPGVSIHELRMIDRTDWGENQVNVREIVSDL